MALPPKQYADFRPAWKSFAVYFFGVFVFLAGPRFNPEAMIGPALGQLIATLFLAFILIRRFCYRYRIDGQTVTVEATFPKKTTKSLAIGQIRRVDLRRGMVQRLLGVAHVWLYAEGRQEPYLKLYGVPEPDLLRQSLIQLGAGGETTHGAWRR